MKKSKIIQKTVKLFLAFVMFLGVLFQNSSLTSAQGTEVDRVSTKITRFEIKNHVELQKMVYNKSLFNHFLDIDFEETREFKANGFLMEAFKLYEEKQYSLAKAKFRELANTAFRQISLCVNLIFNASP